MLTNTQAQTPPTPHHTHTLKLYMVESYDGQHYFDSFIIIQVIITIPGVGPYKREKCITTVDGFIIGRTVCQR